MRTTFFILGIEFCMSLGILQRYRLPGPYLDRRQHTSDMGLSHGLCIFRRKYIQYLEWHYNSQCFVQIAWVNDTPSQSAQLLQSSTENYLVIFLAIDYGTTEKINLETELLLVSRCSFLQNNQLLYLTVVCLYSLNSEFWDRPECFQYNDGNSRNILGLNMIRRQI
jgi:hypothetical protein